ncbi:MAG: hypothetical protein ACO3FJ_08860 [Ilumatobacteraceae bacterium]
MKEYKNQLGQLHRTDGPAVEYSDGDRLWCINGKLHREDGPAVENNRYKSWFINGLRHREDGPAIEYSYGGKRWYLSDIEYTEDQYQHELAKIKLKRLIKL